MQKNHPYFVSLLALVGLLFAEPLFAQAHALDVINSLRNKDCAGASSATKPLKTNAKLAAAARYVDSGRKVRDALNRADYRADQSAVIHLGGTIDDAALQRVLVKSYCDTVTDTGLIDVGIFVGAHSVVMIFAAPFSPPAPAEASQIERQVLQLVNEARAKPRRCGKQSLNTAPPLKLNERLLIAATAHAKDMAKRGLIAHEGADGSSPGDRATRAGYVWKAVGENVAGGQLTAKEVVAGWLSSPGHCANIMDADFTQMAVAYVIDPKQELGIFWAQEFGRPK